MTESRKLQNIPLERIKPVDGMFITAAIWEQAHEYHRLGLSAHQRLLHGAGLVTGLDVIASEPPDSCVTILPGAALDANGNLIVLSGPVTFDFANAQGQLYLVLSYEESRPEQSRNGGPLFIHSQYSIEVSANPPQEPAVELARIRRLPGESLQNAPAPASPKANEIDLRFRLEGAVVGQEPPAWIAVCPVGAPALATADHGSLPLARALQHAGQRACVDVSVPLDARLGQYTLIYLVAGTSFRLSRDEMNALYAAIRSGSTVFMETCRDGQPAGSAPVAGAFQDLASSFGIPLGAPTAASALMNEPHLFAALPDGFETEGTPDLMVGDGLIVSLSDYGCLWRGARRGRPATREEIRSAQEWGENLMKYAVRRKREMPAK